MPVVSVSLPDSLVSQMDQARGSSGRSAFVRAALGDRIAKKLPEGHTHGSITVAYAHGNEARISHVRHAFHDVVLSMMHTHCDPEQCMDVLLVGGDAARIGELHRALEENRAVQRAVFVPITKTMAGADDAGP